LASEKHRKPTCHTGQILIAGEKVDLNAPENQVGRNKKLIDMKKNVSIVFVSTMIMLTSCATLFTGTKDRISFNSTPSGATIYIDGIEQCKTPCTLKVKRSLSDKDVEFKLDGYETRLITLSKDFNVISVLNLGNLFGWAIDALSGAVMKYDKKTYDITLDNKSTSMINPTRINIDTNLNVVELFIVEE